MKFKSLLFKTLIEKLVITERIINISDVKITILSVFTFKLNKLIFEKYSGNWKDQKIIWNKGNKKLRKNKDAQKINASNPLKPESLIFFICLSLPVLKKKNFE